MTYTETINKLYTQLPMFSRTGAAAYKKDLHNTIALCAAVHNPERKFKSIHVAGTNGKGSTCHMLAAILQTAGYKTGLYTSPHIKDFKERIRINGLPISEQFVVDFVERTASVTEEIQPSFFELTVAMAFEYFASQEVDIAIIETGLGGLLDSTNVITPILSIITNIGYDHQNILGNSLEEIATQKAGIIKQNVPVIIGEANENIKKIFANTSHEKNAQIIYTEEHHRVEYIDPEGGLFLCNVKNLNTNVTEKLRLDLTGLYQAKNVCPVLCAMSVLNLNGFTITEDHIHKGLENVRSLTGICGRWDIISNHPAIIADVAHNQDGIKYVIAQLNNDYPLAEKHFVIGFVNDKDIDSVLEVFPDNGKFYFTNAAIPRAIPHEMLRKKAAEKELIGEGYDNVNLALRAAKEAADENDVIMICGSFYMLGELEESCV